MTNLIKCACVVLLGGLIGFILALNNTLPAAAAAWPTAPEGQVQAQVPPDPGDINALVCVDLFGTPAYAQDGKQHQQFWINPTGRTLYLTQIYIWTGCTYNSLCDVQADVRHRADNSQVAIHQWDHYAKPISPVGLTFNFAPYYVVVAGDGKDGLNLNFFTNAFVPGEASAHVVKGWFRYAPVGLSVPQGGPQFRFMTFPDVTPGQSVLPGIQ